MAPIEKKIPDLLTFGNLCCGFLGLMACLNGDLVTAGALVFVGAIFDLFDGMAAKLLKASSAIGAQLDSMADIITFGALPGTIVYMLLVKTHANWLDIGYIYELPVFIFIPFLIVAAAAYRLARFNTASGVSNMMETGQGTGNGIAQREKDNYFEGMPTPAAAMFFASLPLALQYDVFLIKFDIYYVSQIFLNPYFLLGAIFLFTWLMVSKVSLFSLKLSSLRGPKGKVIILFLVISAALFAFLLWAAIPIVILLYIIFSYFIKPSLNEIQSAD